jgi:hypothetical protein
LISLQVRIYSRTGLIKSRNYLLFTLILLSGLLADRPCSAQEDNSMPDTSLASKHDPRKATMYSAFVPGMGQVYNQKYWKVPLVYGLGGAMVYFIDYNQSKYKQFKEAYAAGNTQEYYIIEGRKYTYDQLTMGRDYYRRYRDLSVFGLAAVYFLNIVDAMVDAYFTQFDVSDNLALRIQPAIVDNFDFTASLGVKIKFSF